MSSSRLTLFICEFITGGGLCNAPLSNSLVTEGALMRDALCQALIALDQFELITTHDKRIGASHLVANSMAVTQDFDIVFNQRVLEADIVWLIAPESEGILSRLSQQCLEAGVILLSSGVSVLDITANKLACSALLDAANIPVIPSFSAPDWVLNQYPSCQKNNHQAEKWVVKPIDGVGCEDVQLFDDHQKLYTWLMQSDQTDHFLIQPYCQGISASFSMLCKDGQAHLLSCNEQHIVIEENVFLLEGITVNGMAQYWPQLEALAQRIAKVLPEAFGYIGVDVMIDAAHDKISVIEINPRLTTSFVAMGEATGCNVAALIIEHAFSSGFHCPTIEQNVVSLRI